MAKGIRIESNGMVDGVVLAQLIENRRLKFETFPGKKGSQVSGFSDKAKIYERWDIFLINLRIRSSNK